MNHKSTNYLYHFWGKVKHGQNRGKKLGFPTANIKLHKNLPEGVYLSIATIKIKSFSNTLKGNNETVKQCSNNNFLYLPSLTFIGRAKTFNENFYHSETFILNFNQSLYGHWISIKLIKKIRNNQKFKSVEDLIEQIKKDKKEAEIYFKI